MGNSHETKEYSHALEQCLNHNPKQRIIALLSYALYKEDIRELTKKGEHVPQSAERYLSPNMLNAFSASARELLTESFEETFPPAERNAVNAIKSLEGKLGYIPSILKGFFVSVAVIAVWVILTLMIKGFTGWNLVQHLLN